MTNPPIGIWYKGDTTPKAGAYWVVLCARPGAIYLRHLRATREGGRYWGDPNEQVAAWAAASVPVCPATIHDLPEWKGKVSP